jgi:hypothetical protein
VRRPRLRAAGLLLATAIGSAACGSTVQVTGGAALQGGGLQAPAEVPADAGPSGASPGVPGPGGTVVGPLPSASGGSAGTTTTGGQPPVGRTATGAPIGPGVTDSSIAIGILYCNDCAAGNAALGAGGEDPGDTRRYYQAALDDVNARGGVLGRKLVPVWHEGSAYDTDLAHASQAACEALTKDHKVLFMALRGEVAYECARKAGILVLGSGDSGPMFTKYPNMFAPGLIRLERLFELTVKAMAAAGWQKPETRWPTGRIGLITWDDAQYRYAMKNGYLKGMREAGLKATDVRYIAVPQSATSVAEASAAISSAVLSFQQQGIDHVFIGDGPAGVFVGTGLTLLFLQNAKSQGYDPRYGFNSYNPPGFDQHPKDQLRGMLAIDFSDGAADNDQGLPLNPVRERCFAIMRKKGLPVGDDSTRKQALDACWYLWFTEAVLKRATAGTDLPHMIAAAESLGVSYRSPSSYGDRYSRAQHDGARLVRLLRFDDGCSCNRYTSKPFEP